jgi:hypothetical protein
VTIFFAKKWGLGFFAKKVVMSDAGIEMKEVKEEDNGFVFVEPPAKESHVQAAKRRQQELLLGILADNVRLGIVPQDEESKRSKKIKERAEKITAEDRVNIARVKNPDAGL